MIDDREDWPGGKTTVPIRVLEHKDDQINEARLALDYLLNAIKREQPVYRDGLKEVTLTLDGVDISVFNFARAKLEERP